MNLEQLNAMSDIELNELSAVKVLGWKRVSRPGGGGGVIAWEDGNKRMIRIIQDNSLMGQYCERCDKWNPTTDMNDAMELYKALGNREKNSFVKHMLSFFENVSKHGLETWDIVEMLKLPLKYWVIASILAKG